MRITLIVFGRLEQRSGGYRYDRALVEDLTGRGHGVTVISQIPRLNYAQQIVLGHIESRATGRHRGTLRRVVDSCPDIIVIDELNHAAVEPWIARLHRACGVPIVALIHHLRSDERWGRFYSRAIERRFLRSCQGWLCNSASTFHAAVRCAGGARSSAVVYPSSDFLQRGGAPPTRVFSLAHNRSHMELIAVGAVSARKNYRALLRAIATVEGCNLTIVGVEADLGYANRLRRYARRLGIETRVRWSGYLSQIQLGHAIAASDLLINPSRYEGFGIVYLDALALGVPVIASKRGGGGEVVRDGIDGVLVSPHSWRSIARVLRRLRSDHNRLAALRRGAARSSYRFVSWRESLSGAHAFLAYIVGAAVPGNGVGEEAASSNTSRV